MFKIKDGTIHCSRGDGGTISLRVPFTDVNDYIKYQDKSGNVYWYDAKKEFLYDSAYKESSVALDTLSVVYYQFQIGDKITFNIYEKNGYNKEPLMTKTTEVVAITEVVDISLTEEDTTFGNPVNKETIFWYDITLNSDLTIVCYNEDGPKEFIVYPAKGDGE